MEGGTKGHKTSLPGVKTMKKQPGHLPQTTHLRSSPGEDGTLLPIPFWRSCVLSEDTGDGQRKCWVSPHLCSFVPMFLLFTKQWPKERGLAPAGGNSPSAWMAPAGVSRLSHPHAAPFSPAPQHRSTPCTRPTWGQTPSTDPSLHPSSRHTQPPPNLSLHLHSSRHVSYAPAVPAAPPQPTRASFPAVRLNIPPRPLLQALCPRNPDPIQLWSPRAAQADGGAGCNYSG